MQGRKGRKSEGQWLVRRTKILDVAFRELKLLAAKLSLKDDLSIITKRCLRYWIRGKERKGVDVHLSLNIFAQGNSPLSSKHALLTSYRPMQAVVSNSTWFQRPTSKHPAMLLPNAAVVIPSSAINAKTRDILSTSV